MAGKFPRLSEFAAGKSRKRAKLVFLPYRKVRHNVVRRQQEFVEQILAKLAAGPTFFIYVRKRFGTFNRK